MNGSEFLTTLIQDSEFENPTQVAKVAGVDSKFILRSIKGEGSFRNLNPVIEQLLGDLTPEEFITAINMYRTVRSSIKNQEQFL